MNEVMRLVTPMSILDRAIEQGAPIETLERIMAMQKDLLKDQARMAFSEAFAAFKGEAITIVRNKKITDGPLKGKSYAELFSFVDAVTPALSKHGLSASWAITRDEKEWIEVTCTIEHVLGHVKTASMGGQPDTGGAKNQIQARASTVTYLQRHTLKSACGLAEQGDDTDGNGSADPIGQSKILDAQLERLRALMVEAKTPEATILKHFDLTNLTNMTQAQYTTAVNKLNVKKRPQA